MEKYNYEQVICEDIREYLKENYDQEELREKMENRDDFYEELCDELFCSDSVTGNASGSYFCNAWKAQEALCHNHDLLGEAMREFCCEPNELSRGAEWADVAIRCYLLSGCINKVLDEIEDEMYENE